MIKNFSPSILLLFCICAAASWLPSYGINVSSSANPDPTPPDAPAAQKPVTEKSLPLAILKDQIPIWTSPIRIRPHDLIWLLPLGAATGVTLATDTDAMRGISHDRSFNKDNVDASNYLLGGEIAAPVALYGVGLIEKDSHARETGLLSGEAVVDSGIIEEVANVIFRRERPLADNAADGFFTSGLGTNGSFPSSHSIAAWSIAAVVAGEYPSRWVEASAYAMATGVDVTRVLGQEHFPTDVLVASAAGWLIGHYVLSKHKHGQAR